MRITIKEFEDKLKEMRENGASDDTEIDFDLIDTDIECDEFFPSFYYQNCGSFDYIQITLTGNNV